MDPLTVHFRSSTPSLVLVAALLLTGAPAAQVGSVDGEQKISETSGGFGGPLLENNSFGDAVAGLGDLDGDGVVDLAVGVDDGDLGNLPGAVWILFLNADGTVRNEQPIGEGVGGFGGDLLSIDKFGTALASLGDLDGDGVTDLAVGAAADSEGGSARGAVWILFLNADGTVKAEQKICQTTGGFGGTLEDGDELGTSLAALGDLDGDGIVDLTAGAQWDDDGVGFRGTGAVWILFLNADGTVKDEQKISQTAGGFGGNLDREDFFGTSVASLGDLDGDGLPDLAVGAHLDDDGGGSGNQGAVWILFLNEDGTVRSEQKISATAGGFGGSLATNAFFGRSVACPGDLDADGVAEFAVGAPVNGDGSGENGAVWMLFLNTDGTVESELRISEGQGGFGGEISNDWFAYSLAALGDVDGDGAVDLGAGAIRDDDGGTNQGAVWVLFLEGAAPCFTLDFETEDDLATALVNGQHVDSEFGALVTLSSAGANAGLAIFDSTAGGPNDPSQDPDLLVGSGNLLILQTENLPPDADDVFPRPNDDEDGGTLSFAFVRAVVLGSVRLVDVDAGDGASTLVLTDGSGLQRTYTVPSDWTGDRTLGQPGHGTLDLATLAPQPGFGSVATAVEAAGFDPLGVVRLELRLNGSGGVDDLTFCVPDLPQATARARNGSGLNPRLLSASSLPVLGSVWSTSLDCRPFGSGTAVIELRRAPAAGTLTRFGEVLVGGALVHRAVRPFAAAPSLLELPLPRNVALCGFALHVQGFCRTSAPDPLLPKARAVRSRLTNALDVVLGF